MVSNKKYGKFFSIILLIIISTTCVVAYPELTYSQTAFPSGVVNIVAQASSGTQVLLYLNNNFVNTVDVIADETIVLLEGSDIQNQLMPFAGTITFKNNDVRVYTLSIAGGPSKTLNYGDTISYTATDLNPVSYTDLETGISKTINVENTLVDINFPEVNANLVDGSNAVKFVQHYPYPAYANTKDYEFSVEYDKYPNSVYIDNFVNVTQKRTINISGRVADMTYPLFYILNINPASAGNIMAFTKILTDGNLFSATIPNLREGNNDIYFITTDVSNQNIFTAQKKITVMVDTQNPEIEINSVKYRASQDKYDTVLSELDENFYLNGRELKLNLSTDASLMNYTYNGAMYSQEVENGIVKLNLNLEAGQNNLTLIAIDRAGNIYKEAHNIFYDNEKPKLIKESLEPEEMFKNEKARFFFQNIEGKTNKPDVDITIFTIPQNAQDCDGNRITCKDYEPIFIRNLGQLDSERVDYPEINLNETQVSLLNWMFQQTTVSSDNDGDFEAIIGLQEATFGVSDYNNAGSESPKVDSVESKNYICFVLSDRYGNVNIQQEIVMLDAGNTMWAPGEVTTMPSTIYAAEIENVGDIRSGSGNVEFGIIARFQYIGPGKVTHLTKFSVNEDTSISKDSKYIQIDKSRINHVLDKNTGELTVYFPITVSPMNIEPLDYPDELELAFKADVRYKVDNIDIPIDEQNPIYFQTSVNIERPLDSAKWLTPSTIDDWIGYLNKSIDFTEKAVDWTGKASVVGVLACTAAKFWYGIESVSASTPEEKNNLKKNMFMVCDRVACTSSPDECSNQNSFFQIENGKTTFSGSEIGDDPTSQFISATDDTEIMGRVTGMRVGGECPLSDGQTGVYVNVDVEKYEKDESLGGWAKAEEKSELYLPRQCVEAKYTVDATTGKKTYTGVNLQGISGACFTEDAPYFDGTRCMIPGLETTGAAGWDPANNIIESIRCGCITDTYSHLKNYLKIMKSIRGCLEQAKIGVVKGSYCERLIGIAVCDIATNILFKLDKIMEMTDRTGTDGVDTHNVLVQGLQGMKEGDKILNERYKGTFWSQAGLSSDEIVNKVCLASLTGDWSTLTENILTSVDQNEVDPIFGPALATSRVQGYNPFTGELSILYRFTYAAVSGGQDIRTKVEFICDDNAPGHEYCPVGYHVSTEEKMDSSFSLGILSVRKGGSVQDTIAVTDTSAKFRYNKIRLVHTYTLEGVKKIYEQEEQIFGKGNFELANCYFTGGVVGEGAGFKCDSLFNDNSVISMYDITDDSALVPKGTDSRTVYYPGNKILMNLKTKIIQDEFSGTQTNFKLYYKMLCKGMEKYAFGYKPVTIPNGDIYQSQLVPLIEVPELGSGNVETAYTSASVSLNAGQSLTKLTSVSKTTSSTGVTTTAFTIQEVLLDGKQIGAMSSVVVKVDDQGNIVDANQVVLPINTYIEQLTAEAKAANTELIWPKTLTVKIDRKVENLDIILETNQGNLPLKFAEQAGDTSAEDLMNIQSGTCDASFRLVPSSISLTEDEFDTYNPYGDDVETSDNLKTEPFKTTFIVSKNTQSNHQFIFDIIRPSDETLCVDTNGNVEIPIEVVGVCSQKSFNYEKYSGFFTVKLVLQNVNIENNEQGSISYDSKNNIYVETKTFNVGSQEKFVTGVDGTLYVTFDVNKDKGEFDPVIDMQKSEKKVSIRLEKCN